MAWDQDDVEGEALSLRRAAGLDAVQPINGLQLARRIVGSTNVRWTSVLDELGRPARSCRTGDGTWVIELASRLVHQPIAANWWPTHEAVEVSLASRRYPYVEADVERVCNQVAAAALVPRPALRVAVDCWGLQLPQLAAQFVVGEFALVLRLGEALDYPVALLCEQPLLERVPFVVRRGPPLPATDRDLWKWVRDLRRPHPRLADVHRRRLTDRPIFHAFIGPRGGE